MATEKRVLCDTNILLDLCDAERPHYEDAVALVWYAGLHPSAIRLLAAVSSFKDAYYILSRLYRSEPMARESVQSLMGTCIVSVDMLGAYGAEALQSGEPDFEDGLIRACAEHEHADVIITNDDRAFAGSAVPAMSASQFLAQEGFDYDVIDL